MRFLVYVLVIKHLAEEERDGSFTLISCLVSCDCLCSVSLLHGAMYWSAVCDCGIFWP